MSKTPISITREDFPEYPSNIHLRYCYDKLRKVALGNNIGSGLRVSNLRKQNRYKDQVIAQIRSDMQVLVNEKRQLAQELDGLLNAIDNDVDFYEQVSELANQLNAGLDQYYAGNGKYQGGFNIRALTDAVLHFKTEFKRLVSRRTPNDVNQGQIEAGEGPAAP